MKRPIALAIIVAAVLGVSYAANLIASPAPIVTLRTADVDSAELDRLITVFEDHAEAGVTNAYVAAELGSLYLTRAQITSSGTDYTRALDVLSPFADLPDPSIALPLARTQLAVHDFSGALDTISSLPRDASPLTRSSITFDAHLGTGALDLAGVELTELLRAHPDEPAILIRKAELAFLSGDTDTALDASEEALEIADKANLGPEDFTFYLTAHARLLLFAGEYGAAAELTDRSLHIEDADPAARLISARAAAALGDIPRAIETAQAAADLAPEPATLAFLADLHLTRGDSDAADVELDTIEAIARLERAVDRRTVAQALAEHGRAPDLVLDLARRELMERSDPYAHHLMATALHATGASERAETHFDVASQVNDALIWYRGGLIAEANGDIRAAVERFERALDISPSFHPLYAADAEARSERLSS